MPGPAMETNDGELWVVCGSSRSGKTVFVWTELAQYSRVLVWDIEGQYTGPGWQRFTRQKALADHLAKVGSRPAKIAYTGPPGDFGFWADCAFVWGRVAPSAIVAEEIADVTNPGKAPAQWGMLLRRILKHGSTVYAITQRPSESDKTAIGNATKIHVCRMTRAQDRRYMAAEIDVPVDALLELQSDPAVELRCLQRDMKTGKVRAGRLTFPRKKPRFSFKDGIAF